MPYPTPLPLYPPPPPLPPPTLAARLRVDARQIRLQLVLVPSTTFGRSDQRQLAHKSDVWGQRSRKVQEAFAVDQRRGDSEGTTGPKVVIARKC